MERKEIFQNVNFWLQFAEAKNGALLTLNGFIILSTLDLFEKFKNLYFYRIAYAIFLILILLSLLNNLFSFFPIKKLGKLNKPNNVIFWDHISKHNSTESYSFLLNQEFKEINAHIEDEILVNSKIAERKYAIFRHSLLLTFCAISFFSIYSLLIILNIL